MSKVKYAGRLHEPIKLYKIHSHEFWEVVRYTKGSGVVEIGGETVPFREGDVFVIPPGVEHSDSAEAGFQNYHYEFEDSAFPMRHWITFRDSENNDFLNVMEVLYREYLLKRDNYKEIVDNLHAVLLCYMTSFMKEKPVNTYVAFAIDSIIANFSNPSYTFAETQALIPMNEDYFRRLFESETGHTPLRHLTWVRIEHAKRLLHLRPRSGLSIQEIAWMSGFRDSLYFSRIFRRETGMAPSEWK
ncbi:MAG: AraC family transcriptional regulator [Clostridia bacterium]|nr:AraC family transcriptional regulator [Clostridia bacterium]